MLFSIPLGGSDVEIRDLGVTYSAPLTNHPILEDFSLLDLASSQSLSTILENGTALLYSSSGQRLYSVSQGLMSAMEVGNEAAKVNLHFYGGDAPTTISSKKWQVVGSLSQSNLPASNLEISLSAVWYTSSLSFGVELEVLVNGQPFLEFERTRLSMVSTKQDIHLTKPFSHSGGDLTVQVRARAEKRQFWSEIEQVFLKVMSL